MAKGHSAADIVRVSAGGTIPTHFSAALNATPMPLVSLRDVAKRCGMTLEQMSSLRLALGFQAEDPDRTDVPESLIEDAELFKFALEQFGEERTLALARVIGTSVSNIVEATRAAFSEAVVEESMSELEVSNRNEITLVGWTMLHDLLGNLLREWSRRGYEFFGAILEGDAILAVAFIDLVGFTAWSSSRATEVQKAGLMAFERLAWESAVSHGGRLVKLIGDEAMVVTIEPKEACLIALELCQGVGALEILPEARGAVGFGPVTVRDGDFFGPVVNLVSRATKEARPGQVVTTDSVAKILDPEVWDLEDLGHRTIRGLESPVNLFALGSATTRSQ